jgi:hypothetical protein
MLVAHLDTYTSRKFGLAPHPVSRGYSVSDRPAAVAVALAVVSDALSLDPPMILKTGSRSPRSDPRYLFQEAALTRCSLNSADQGADLLKHR